MYGILTPIKDILTTVSAMVADDLTAPIFSTVRVWNNQVQQQEQGKLEAFLFPAMFLEVVPPVFTRIGLGANQADITFRAHILHEWYDSQDGTFEQDLVVFELRDKLIATLTNFQPTSCSMLNLTGETQDYEHTNVYHYIVEFNCAFIDSIGMTEYIEKEAPTDLEINVYVAENITPTPVSMDVTQQTQLLQAYYTSPSGGETSVFVLDAQGSTIAGNDVVSVQLEVLPLIPAKWTWNKPDGFIYLLGGLSMGPGQTLFVLYNKNIS